MTRSSRHKSHKQSKHSSKDAKDYISDTEEDLKIKERSYTRDEGRVSKESIYLASGEKRKLTSSLPSKEGKEGKDMNYSGNGDASEEYLSSKRRKEKSESIRGGDDRWKVVGDEKDDSGAMEKDVRGESLGNDSGKGLKSRESKSSSDLKNKSSRRHESEAKKEEKNVTSVVKGEEEENRSGSTRADSKRISEKDSSKREGRNSKETKVKEKDRVSDRDSKKLQENKQESEFPDRDSKKLQENKEESELLVSVGSVEKRHDLLYKDANKDRPSKRSKENSELGVLDEFHTSELEKEREKRIRKKKEGSDDKESDNINVSSKGDRSKDGRYKDEKYKSGNHGEKYQDNKEKDDKHREPVGGDRDSRHREVKYRDDGERESKRREDRCHDVSDRDGKHRVESERDVKPRDDIFTEDNDRENKHRDNKHSRRVSRYLEDGTRDDRLKDEKHREKNDRHKEDKIREDYHRDRELRDDFDREKRVREGRYKSDPKNSMLSIHDKSASSDDRARLKDVQGRKRTSDKDDYNDMRSRGFKDRRYDVEKRSTSDVGVDIATDKGRSGSRYADVEANINRGKNQGSPSSSSHATRDQYRVSKQDELKNREYEERVRHGVTSNRDYSSAVVLIDKISLSRPSEKVIPRDDGLIGGDLSTDRRMKTDIIRNSPRQLVVDKSPSVATGDRRFFGRSDFRKSDDAEESGQRSVGFKEVKNYSGREGRGTRELVSETRLGDEPSRGDADVISNSSKSFSHHPPPFFRGGTDSPQPFRSGEDDGRMMKSNNRYNNRRNGDPNMVRLQGGGPPWKGLPNWPSPIPNGFVPFQHGPHIGFHHAMQQFPPAPPIIGLRPPNMELNHPGVPYPLSDNDRFPIHGHHVGWRTPMYDPFPPLHGWESNDAESGRHGRSLQGGSRPWELNSKPIAANIELPLHAFEKDTNQSIEYLTPPRHLSKQVNNEQSNHSAQSTDMMDTKNPTASDVVLEESINNLPEITEKDDAQFCFAYLSKLDISVELTDPELCNRYNEIVNNVDNKAMMPDSKEDLILYVEQAAESKEKNYSKLSTVDDSLFQKALSLYKKGKEELAISCHHLISKDDVPLNPNQKCDFTSSVPMETEESSSGCFHASRAEAVIVLVPPPPTDSTDNQEILVVNKNGSLDMSNVPSFSTSRAHEIDGVAELESGSVKFNRIHHSPESTH